MKHWNWNKLYRVWLSRGHMMQHLEVYLIFCACIYHPPILYWGNFHQHWHWEICWPFNQILSEVTLLAALRLDDGQIFVPMRWRGSFFLSDAYNKLNIQPFLAISAESILSQMPVDAKYQRLELSSIKKKISMPTAFQIQGKPNWFSLLPPLSLFAARFLTERNTRDPIVLQKSDKGQLFDGSSQTCSRISRLFVGRLPCWKKLLIQELAPGMPSTPPLMPFRPPGCHPLPPWNP